MNRIYLFLFSLLIILIIINIGLLLFICLYLKYKFQLGEILPQRCLNNKKKNYSCQDSQVQNQKLKKFINSLTHQPSIDSD